MTRTRTRTTKVTTISLLVLRTGDLKLIVILGPGVMERTLTFAKDGQITNETSESLQLIVSFCEHKHSRDNGKDTNFSQGQIIYKQSQRELSVLFAIYEYGQIYEVSLIIIIFHTVHELWYGHKRKTSSVWSGTHGHGYTLDPLHRSLKCGTQY